MLNPKVSVVLAPLILMHQCVVAIKDGKHQPQENTSCKDCLLFLFPVKDNYWEKNESKIGEEWNNPQVMVQIHESDDSRS